MENIADAVDDTHFHPCRNLVRLSLGCQQPDSIGYARTRINKKEILRLADEEDFPPAMYVVGLLSSHRIDTDDRARIGSFSFYVTPEENPFSKNLGISNRYLRKAVDLGFAEAMYELAICYAYRGAIPANILVTGQDIVDLFRQAANTGHAHASQCLAKALADKNLASELGFKADVEEAVRILRRLVRKCSPDVVESATHLLKEMGQSVE